MAGGDGSVYPIGAAPALGSVAALHLDSGVSGRALLRDLHLNKPIVGMAALPDGSGYWLVAGDGGVFAFGDARFRGSLGRVQLARPIVAMAATPDGRGYWLVASDGGVFAFGDARFFGSLGRVHLVTPVVATAAKPGGTGYWLISADGSVFAFGRSGYFGSAAGRTTAGAVGIAPSGAYGYGIAAADGQVWQFEPGLAPRLALKLPVPASYLMAGTQRLQAQTAVAVALAEVGKPYSVGGSGPYSFDCSGLTQFAWGAAGVALPRTAAEQFAAVPHVSLADAEPGDLVFFYPGIEHVGIYLGDGMMVDAPHTGAYVRVENFTVPGWGPVMGVGRPG